MTLTPSNMLPLGTIAPNFRLPDTLSGNLVSLHDQKPTSALVIMFICNHCPYVRHIQKKLVHFVKEYQTKSVQFVAISANDPHDYPADSPDQMKKVATELDFSFPYLFDETQQTAQAYQAACTPDFYIFDKNMACVYRGRFDESTPGNNIPVTGKDLRHALDAILAGQKISDEQHPSMGCNIKWKHTASL